MAKLFSRGDRHTMLTKPAKSDSHPALIAPWGIAFVADFARMRAKHETPHQADGGPDPIKEIEVRRIARVMDWCVQLGMSGGVSIFRRHHRK